MKSIHSITKNELALEIARFTPKKYRVKQIWDGVYKHFYQQWENYTTLPNELIEYLSQHYTLTSVRQVDYLTSPDGLTTKYLLRLSDNAAIEAVLLRNDSRNTICISTQVGCPVGCSFCATGAAGFSRNLITNEIVDQVSFIANLLAQNNEQITNIVLMGMGEPFLNYDNTVSAIAIFNDADRFDIGARRITVSTIGIPERIRQFAEIGKQYNLAISLHAPTDKIRTQLVPLAKKYSIEEIINAAKLYVNRTNRRITYEYVLIKGINDGLVHAKELADLVHGQKCHINLIALNENKHFEGKAPDDASIHDFIQVLLDRGITTTLRNSQGAGIQAGCGQLSGKYNNKEEKCKT